MMIKLVIYLYFIGGGALLADHDDLRYETIEECKRAIPEATHKFKQDLPEEIYYSVLYSVSFCEEIPSA